MNKKTTPGEQLVFNFSDEIFCYLCKKQAEVISSIGKHGDIEASKIRKILDAIKRSKDDVRRAKNYFS